MYFYSSKSKIELVILKLNLVEAISPKYFNNKIKTSVLLSLSSILNLLLPESQPYKNVYDSLNNLMKNFDKKYDYTLYLLGIKFIKRT